jgi:hypothetical protein
VAAFASTTIRPVTSAIKAFNRACCFAVQGLQGNVQIQFLGKSADEISWVPGLPIHVEYLAVLTVEKDFCINDFNGTVELICQLAGSMA